MIRFARDFRLIPIVLVATISLFALKVSGLVFDGGYTLAERLAQRATSRDLTIDAAESVPDYPKIIVADGSPERRDLPASHDNPGRRQMFNFERRRQKRHHRLGRRKATKPAEAAAQDERASRPSRQSRGRRHRRSRIEPGRSPRPASAPCSSACSDRRQELDARNRELDMRENLLKAAEKRLEAKVGELKDIEARVKTAIGNRDKAEAQRFKSIVVDVREHEAEGCRAHLRPARH